MAVLGWASWILAEALLAQGAGSEESKAALRKATEIAETRKLGILLRRIKALLARIE